MRKILPFILFNLLFLASCNSNTFINEKLEQHKEVTLMIKEKVPEEFFPQDVKIVSVGDSLTQGVGDSTNRGGYVPYLEELLEKDKSINDALFDNFGIRGNRSDQLLKRIASSEVRDAVKEADYVIVTIGGNDVMKVVRENFSNLNLKAFSQQRKVYEKNLKEVLTTVRNDNPNSKIILVGLYNPFFKWFADIREINEIIGEWNQVSQDVLMKYRNTYFVGIADLFYDEGENLLHTDYFHPNDQGYELIANRIFEKINEEVLEKASTENKENGN
ncbi:SGNH/GDSL hydrolase family protein [Cytobacillus solani]|uniref:SGNH/GDSL hydrolase family protein n=1 Tax=Cytobacillus solani TaxID=1637975 RepID=UPI002079525F|nr:SGNH/GDSL hydrolase family protein [Cytobacillus solani]USK53391.1 SGNH/GDSL hydrolase family protein [Cytobacillus solani]